VSTASPHASHVPPDVVDELDVLDAAVDAVVALLLLPLPVDDVGLPLFDAERW
jgi:hypothetical protein